MTTISFQKAVGLAENALRLRAERAGVISSNLANVDTPNYKARDFDFHKALKSQMGNSDSRMDKTHEGHMEVSRGARGDDDYSYRIPQQPSVDGNTVEENIEHAEFTRNNLEFQAAFTFLNGNFKGLQKAIRGE
ncbi:flagellar basal body rod protein FlgB [Agarilytica rhodophyticola]|uniref:flagellar basal body rod protein FlgB n=1 Tax=Agarilytica rhodophyticola TaxID=1737490 RepID=UPI000B346590|nr:flagellar basal body rod protein FlgB [Agarilytica rhodophyticola]